MLVQAKLEDVKKLYADQIKDLEAMKVTRPAKPAAAEKVRHKKDKREKENDNDASTFVQPAEPAAAPAPEAAKA